MKSMKLRLLSSDRSFSIMTGMVNEIRCYHLARHVRDLGTFRCPVERTCLLPIVAVSQTHKVASIEEMKQIESHPPWLHVLLTCSFVCLLLPPGKPAGFKIQTKRAQSDRLLYADAEKLVHFESEPAKVRTTTDLTCG